MRIKTTDLISSIVGYAFGALFCITVILWVVFIAILPIYGIWWLIR